jgi:hypothetical protein
MKTVTADLSDEGRQDILERVRSYRGGASLACLICVTTYSFSVVRLYPRGQSWRTRFEVHAEKYVDLGSS